MTRTECKLFDGANLHWPGSGMDLVTVYRAFPGRELRLWAAAMIAVLLREPRDRTGCLAEMRKRLPKVTRQGPKALRVDAAKLALDRLEDAVRHAAAKAFK